MANILVSKNHLQKYIKDKLPEDNILEEKLTMHIFEVEGKEVIELEDENGTKILDTVFDIKVLPDRSGYCFSHRYVAQEIATILKSEYIKPQFEDITGENASDRATINMFVETPEINPLHLIRKISNIDNSSAESPVWLKNFLKAMGQRSINYIVDITNFVMLDTGQPVHAFDADKVKGDLVVRYAKEGEKITLLDGKEVELDSSILVIADDVNLLDITGIKGGKVAEVTKDTKNIILIAGNFNPAYIRKTSQKINLKNDSSKRFENAVTIERPRLAVQEFSALLKEGEKNNKFGSINFEKIVQIGDNSILPKVISIDSSYINQRIGIDISVEEMSDILTRLDFNPEIDGKTINITVPVYRADISIAEDVADEIGRLHGYDSLKGVDLPKNSNRPISKSFEYANRVRLGLVEIGFSEVLTYTLRDKGDIELANPLNVERGYLRNRLGEVFPKVLEINIHNIDFIGTDLIKIFEIGKIFSGKIEKLSLSIGVSSRAGKDNKKKIDIVIEESLCIIARIFKVEVSDIVKKDISSVTTGENLIYEIDLENLINSSDPITEEIKVSNKDIIKFKKFSLYPYIVRDIAVFIPGPRGKAFELQNTITSINSDLIVKIYQFDEFEKKLKDNEGNQMNEVEKTSYAFRIIFQAYDRTLTDIEVDTIMQELYSKIRENAGWEIR